MQSLNSSVTFSVGNHKAPPSRGICQLSWCWNVALNSLCCRSGAAVGACRQRCRKPQIKVNGDGSHCEQKMGKYHKGSEKHRQLWMGHLRRNEFHCVLTLLVTTTGPYRQSREQSTSYDLWPSLLVCFLHVNRVHRMWTLNHCRPKSMISSKSLIRQPWDQSRKWVLIRVLSSLHCSRSCACSVEPCVLYSNFLFILVSFLFKIKLHMYKILLFAPWKSPDANSLHCMYLYQTSLAFWGCYLECFSVLVYWIFLDSALSLWHCHDWKGTLNMTLLLESWDWLKVAFPASEVLWFHDVGDWINYGCNDVLCSCSRIVM